MVHHKDGEVPGSAIFALTYLNCSLPKPFHSCGSQWVRPSDSISISRLCTIIIITTTTTTITGHPFFLFSLKPQTPEWNCKKTNKQNKQTKQKTLSHPKKKKKKKTNKQNRKHSKLQNGITAISISGLFYLSPLSSTKQGTM